MNITERINEGFLIFDGAMGSQLQLLGMAPGEHPEDLSVTRADDIVNIHLEYFKAGADVATTNTFGANSLKYTGGAYSLREVIFAAVKNAAHARELCGDKNKYIAFDIGPTGRLISPLGDLDFEAAVETFAEAARLGQEAGADFIIIETMSDIYEAKAAVLGAKEGCDLPVFCTVVIDGSGKMMTGADPETAVAVLEGLGCAAVGINCGIGPDMMINSAARFCAAASVPVIIQPNAGLPRMENGKTVYNITPEDFTRALCEIARGGARILGGCCGTTPEHISLLSRELKSLSPVPLCEKNDTVASSYTHTVTIGDTPVIIGERINPTGKPKLKAALKNGELDSIVEEGVAQREAGAQILDVNCGLPDIDEKEMLLKLSSMLQAVTDTPLQLDTSDPEAMEAALRRYNGKAVINSVSGKKEVMEKIFPLGKKYGGVFVALTLDDNGIPDTAEKRLNIACRILETAEKHGIKKKDIIFDPLAMAVSSDPRAAGETLRAIRLIREKTGCRTVLGVSNISFGLPKRELITSVFYSMALEAGLSAAIMNPFSAEMMKSYRCYLALSGADEGFEGYISFAQSASALSSEGGVSASPADDGSLEYAICKGMQGAAAERTKKLSETVAPLDIINSHIIPALSRVGDGFAAKTLFLPQLMAAADAAKAAFAVAGEALPASAEENKNPVVLATVQGDIHDIGKNIVAALLENFGYRVIDLGRDVPPETVLEAARRENVRLVGLSALMTTTVPAMAQTVALIKKELPHCKCVVGGAVLTREYAEKMGADYYSADAMETVRAADSVYKDS